MSINPVGGLTLPPVPAPDSGQGPDVTTDPVETGQTGGSGETGGTGQTKTDNDNSGGANNPNSGGGTAAEPLPTVRPQAPPEPALIEAITIGAVSDRPAQDLTVEEARALAEAVQKELRQASLIEQVTQTAQAAEAAMVDDRRFAESAEVVRDIERPRGDKTIDLVN